MAYLVYLTVTKRKDYKTFYSVYAEEDRVFCSQQPFPTLSNAKANGKEPKTCLGWVFNYKLGFFQDVHETRVCGHTPMSTVENSAQVSSI